MSLLCSLITKDKTLVICSDSSNEKYKENIEMILPYLKTNKNGRIAIKKIGYTAYYCDYNMFSFICLCNNDLSSVTAFGFLNKIQDDFLMMFPEDTLQSLEYFQYCLNESFQSRLSDQMTIFNIIGFQPVDAVEKLKLGLMDTWNSRIDPVGEYQEDEKTVPITIGYRTMISNTEKSSENNETNNKCCCLSKQGKCFIASIVLVLCFVGILCCIYLFYLK